MFPSGFLFGVRIFDLLVIKLNVNVRIVEKKNVSTSFSLLLAMLGKHSVI